MSDPPPASASPSLVRAPQAADGHGGLRVLALGAVAFGVLLLAAAAFVLSYAGIHEVALSAGVSPRLARIYPLIFDAMLVVTFAAVLSLRGAGLPSRTYAWLSMLVLLAAAAAADALNATGTKLPRRPAAATAAVIPWALVLIGFGLLLCMLRQGRLRRAAAAAASAAQREAVPQPSGHVAVRGMTVTRPAPSNPNGEGPARLILDQPGEAADLPDAATATDVASDLAIDAEPGQDDPASDEARPSELPEFPRTPRRAREEQAAGYGGPYRDRPASAFSPAPTLPQAIDLEADEATPRSVTDPEPASGFDDHHGPEPFTVASHAEPSPVAEPDPDAEPSAEAELSAEAEPDPDAEPSLEAEAGVEAEADAEAEMGREPEPQGESGPDPVAAPEVASAAGTRPDLEGARAQTWPEAQPAPATPQFDRKRSSPVPPEA